MAAEVIWLRDVAGEKKTGGKAMALGRLLSAGFNVPGGFVVTSLGSENDVLSALDELKADKVAVRSSAAAEDGAKDAWAGQLDTFLNVTRDKLLEKIRTCFESAQSDRAKAYADQKNISAGKVAVIVQKMVPAEVSGVAFSANPVTNDHSQMVIESVPGLGEKLVSGSTTPDTYITDRSGDVIESHLAGEKPVLTISQTRELAEKIIQIEKLFDFPVDVEWAYSSGQLYILQSRPITTLG